MGNHSTETKAGILDAARKVFAQCGYSAASIQEIVDKAGVTKPTLYYYFGSKAGLFQALVDHAADERFQLMQDAVRGQKHLEGRLIALVEVLLKYAREQRDLMRIVFSSWFAAPGELPANIDAKKGLRNFELMHKIIKDGIRSGEIDSRLASNEAVSAFAAQLFFHSMAQIGRHRNLYRPVASRTIVRMFLQGVRPAKGRS